ncbi:unnamed protein product [Sympodiomycopsis kandeliae]
MTRSRQSSASGPSPKAGGGTRSRLLSYISSNNDLTNTTVDLSARDNHTSSTSTARSSPPSSSACSSPFLQRKTSLLPGLEMHNDIAESFDHLKSCGEEQMAWFAVGYSSDGQQLPGGPSVASLPSSPDPNAQSQPQPQPRPQSSAIGESPARGRPFMLHVQSKGSMTSFEPDRLMAEIRAALQRNQVQWVVLSCKGRILVAQVFDGDVSGLRRARALVHGRSLTGCLPGVEPMILVSSIDRLTHSWLDLRLSAPMALNATQQRNSLTAPSPLTQDTFLSDHQYPLLSPARQSSRLGITYDDDAPLRDQDRSVDDQPAGTHLWPASPGPPPVPSKDSGYLQAKPITDDERKETLATPHLLMEPFQEPRSHFSWYSSHAPTIEATEDLQDLQDRWSQSLASLKESQETPSSSAIELPKGSRHVERSSSPTASSKSKSSSSQRCQKDQRSTTPTAGTVGVDPVDSHATTPTMEKQLRASTATNQTASSSETRTQTHLEASYDSSDIVQRHRDSESSAVTDYSGTSSEWRMQPEFHLVDGSADDHQQQQQHHQEQQQYDPLTFGVTPLTHPIDRNLPTVIESGESTYLDRLRESTQYSMASRDHAKRRDSHFTTTTRNSAILHSQDAHPLPALPLPSPTTGSSSTPSPEEQRRLEEERSEFLRFQEAERKRVSMLAKSEKRQAEKANQKQDEKRRSEVMKKLMEEQQDISSPSTGSLKAPTKSRPRTSSTSSSVKSRRSQLLPPPSEPLPTPPKTPTSVRTRSRSPLGQSSTNASAAAQGWASSDSPQRDPSSVDSRNRRRGPAKREALSHRKKKSGPRQSAPDSSTAAAGLPDDQSLLSASDSVALLDPALTEAMSKSINFSTFDLTVGSGIKHSETLQRSSHGRVSSDASTTSANSRKALSEVRKEKKRLDEQGLEGSSWISKVSESRVHPRMLSEDQMNDLKAKPQAHHRPHQNGSLSHSPQGSPKHVDKDLPRPPPLSPGLPPKTTSRLSNKEELVDQARRRALAAELAALEQIRVARELQKQLEFELSEVKRRERERSDAENAARAKWAREQAARNRLDAFERSRLESDERKRRAQVEETQKVEKERADRVAYEKHKADQAEREAIEEAARRKENAALRDQRLLEEMQTKQSELEKKEERLRAEAEHKAHLKSDLLQHWQLAALSSSRTLMEGWLDIQPESSTQWRRRYFKLGSTGLSLYKDSPTSFSSDDVPLKTYPSPRQTTSQEEEFFPRAHSTFLLCSTKEQEAETRLVVAFQDARLKERFEAAVEILSEENGYDIG